MKAWALIFVISAATGGSARADWAYTHWGMTPEQVAAQSSGNVKILPEAERTRSEADHWVIAAKGTFKDGPRVLDVGFMFDEKAGLKCILYNALGADVEPVKADLIKRYGPGRTSDYGPTHTITWAEPEKVDITIGDSPLAAVVTHCRPGG